MLPSGPVRALERRVLRPEIGARHPLREAAAAHRALEAGETTGSTILIPESTDSRLRSA